MVLRVTGWLLHCTSVDASRDVESEPADVGSFVGKPSTKPVTNESRWRKRSNEKFGRICVAKGGSVLPLSALQPTGHYFVETARSGSCSNFNSRQCGCQVTICKGKGDRVNMMSFALFLCDSPPSTETLQQLRSDRKQYLQQVTAASSNGTSVACRGAVVHLRGRAPQKSVAWHPFRDEVLAPKIIKAMEAAPGPRYEGSATRPRRRGGANTANRSESVDAAQQISLLTKKMREMVGPAPMRAPVLNIFWVVNNDTCGFCTGSVKDPASAQLYQSLRLAQVSSRANVHFVFENIDESPPTATAAVHCDQWQRVLNAGSATQLSKLVETTHAYMTLVWRGYISVENQVLQAEFHATEESEKFSFATPLKVGDVVYGNFQVRWHADARFCTRVIVLNICLTHCLS